MQYRVNVKTKEEAEADAKKTAWQKELDQDEFGNVAVDPVHDTIAWKVEQIHELVDAAKKEEKAVQLSPFAIKSEEALASEGDASPIPGFNSMVELPPAMTLPDGGNRAVVQMLQQLLQAQQRTDSKLATLAAKLDRPGLSKLPEKIGEKSAAQSHRAASRASPLASPLEGVQQFCSGMFASSKSSASSSAAAQPAVAAAPPASAPAAEDDISCLSA